MSGTLYGVGLGPGDPGLITLKAKEILERAPILAVPADGSGQESLACQVAAEYLAGKEVLSLPAPMIADADSVLTAHVQGAALLAPRLAAGQDVAYLTLGDPSLYSSFGYLAREVSQMGFATQVIPGVTAASAAAARLGEPLALGREALAILPGVPGDQEFPELLRRFSRLVILKPRREYDRLVRLLTQHGLLDRAWQLSWVGWPTERIQRVGGEQPDYFTLIMINGGERP